MMPKYDFLSLIKNKAKTAARDKSIKLSIAQEQLAKSGGFQNFYELRKVASNNSTDIRLMRLALEVDDLYEVIDKDSILYELALTIDDLMSDTIAGTNAGGFQITGLDVNESSYNEDSGTATIEAKITYAGEPDPDRVFSGSSFVLTAVVPIMLRSGIWTLIDDDLKIIEPISDQERDWQKQLAERLLNEMPSK